MKSRKAQVMKKNAQVPFNWIFALVVGGSILFLGLFFAFRFGSAKQYQYDTEIAEKLNIILNPLESVAEAKTTLIEMPVETRLSLRCFYEGIGRQELRINTKSSISSEWQEFSAAQSIANKYLFANAIEQGKTIYVFGKSFSMPFRVSDLIYLPMGTYCFVNPPSPVEDELTAINASNFLVTSDKRKCKGYNRSVCFGQPGCDINVYGFCSGFECRGNSYAYGSIEKKEGGKSTVLYYSGDALLYAALFSSVENYQCNLDRLLYRVGLLSQLYRQKADVLEAKGCGTGTVKARLLDLEYFANTTAKTGKPFEMIPAMDALEQANSELICPVF